MKIDVDGMARQLTAKITQIVETADRYDLYVAIGEVLRSNMMEEQFATMGKSLNKKEWTGLSAGYKKYKQKKGRQGKADLVFTGLLASSFEYNVTAKGVILNNSAPYSKHLQDGTKYMPARPIIPDNLELPQEVIDEIEDKVKIWLINNIKNL